MQGADAVQIDRQGVKWARYDAAARRLYVEFARGARYEYDDVPAGVFTWLCRTPEPGGYVQRVLTPKYRYRAMTQGPAATAAATEAAVTDLVAALEASLRELSRARSKGDSD